METLQDLFVHQLKDLYSAETQLIAAIPKMVKKASHEKLKEALSDHLETTKEHKQRLETIFAHLNEKPTGETCKAMKGLIEEAESFMKEDAPPAVMDAGIIADAQRIEHYEISGYGTAKAYAELMDHEEIEDLLEQTLDEESEANDLLTDLALDEINRYAMEGKKAASAA